MRTEDERPDCPDGIECLTVTPLEEMEESILKSVAEELIEDEENQK